LLGSLGVDAVATNRNGDNALLWPIIDDNSVRIGRLPTAKISVLPYFTENSSKSDLRHSCLGVGLAYVRIAGCLGVRRSPAEFDRIGGQVTALTLVVALFDGGLPALRMSVDILLSRCHVWATQFAT
jgi:hypothetical protein